MFTRPNEALSWVLTPKHSAQKSETAITNLVKCNFCDGDFTEVELSLHERQEHKEEIKEKLSEDENTFCISCLKSFPSKDDMRKHTLSAHLHSSEAALRVEQEIYACAHCHQIFLTKLHLANHILFTHSGAPILKSTKRIECHLCHKKMPICYYIQHNRAQLSKNHMNYCFKCNMKCRSQVALREHIRSHGRHYYCDMCRSSFSSEPTFNMHIKYHRSLVQNVQKVDVSKYFISRSNADDCWKLRKSLFLSGVCLPLNFNICMLCREVCYTLADMRAHVAAHRPRAHARHEYVCACGQTYSNKILLKQHHFQFQGKHHQDSVRQATESASEKMDITEGATPETVPSGASLTSTPSNTAGTEPITSPSNHLDVITTSPAAPSTAKADKSTHIVNRSRTRQEQRRKSLQNVSAELEIVPRASETEEETSDPTDEQVVVFVISDEQN